MLLLQSEKGYLFYKKKIQMFINFNDSRTYLWWINKTIITMKNIKIKILRTVQTVTCTGNH